MRATKRESAKANWLGIVALALGCGGGDGTPGGGDGGIDADPNGPDAATECPDPAPPPATCDFFLGCGCDVGGGEKCTIIAPNRVCTAAGTGLGGTPCVSEADCASGATCATYVGARTCMIFCDDAHPCPTADLACYVRIGDGAEPPNILATVCGQVCSLLDQDCSLPGQACYTSNSVTEMERGVCVGTGILGQGEACTSSNDCLPGFNCINPGSPDPSFCAQFCDRQDNDPACAVGTCTGLPGHTQTGVCVTP